MSGARRPDLCAAAALRRGRALLREGAQVGVRGALALALSGALVVAGADAADAASGGRMGGSGFRAPRAPRAAPARTYGGGGYGYGGYGYGGGGGGVLMSPFLFPAPMYFVGGGGGGLGLLLVLGLGSVVVSRMGSAELGGGSGGKVGVVVLKVGLLGSARELQTRLMRIAEGVDTASASGLYAVLTESVAGLIRADEFWVYGSVDVRGGEGGNVESVYNRLCLEQRVTMKEEVVSNVSGRRVGGGEGADGVDGVDERNEFVVVSIVAAVDGAVVTKMPKVIDDAAALRRALTALGGVTEPGLQGVEVVWSPARMGDCLSETELIRLHPDLRRV